MSKVINDATAATRLAQGHVDRARETLDANFTGRTCNRFGIYSDPSSQRYFLANALRELTAAMKAIDDTNWPSNADYDREG